MIQTLTNNEFPATDIIQLCGNKNPRSVTNYSTAVVNTVSKVNKRCHFSRAL